MTKLIFNSCRVPLNKELKKYYIVVNGREIGIFESYDEVKKMTDKFPNSLYKKYDSYDDATYEFKYSSYITTPSPYKKLEDVKPEFGYKILINKIDLKHQYSLLNIETGKIDYTSSPLRFPIEYIPFIAVFDYFTKVESGYQEGFYLDDFYSDVDNKSISRYNAIDFFKKYEPHFPLCKDMVERYFELHLITFMIKKVNIWDYERWGELMEICY